MCASFLIRANTSEIVEVLQELGHKIKSEALSEYADSSGSVDMRVLPHQKTPVIVLHQDVLEVRHMQFSLIPSWSKERKPKFATHNARIESVLDKPTWRTAFQKRHCLVPMTHFIEPIYTGEYAGHMVRFYSQHQRKTQVLLAAAIWEEWIDRDNKGSSKSHGTGEVIESFSLLTSEPLKFVRETGHDRGLIFLPKSLEKKWLVTEPKNAHVPTPKEWVDLLQESRIEPHLAVESDRPMRPGWQKRA